MAPAYHSPRVQPNPKPNPDRQRSSARPRPLAVSARRRPRLACLGDLVLDVVITPAAELAIGSDTAGSVALRAGGSAANTARAFAALGGEATFIGAIGTDGLGKRLTAALRSEKVRVHTPQVRRPTARLAVLLDRSAERTFVTERGAADWLRPSHLRPAWLTRADALHMPAYSLLTEPLATAAQAAAAHARRAGRLVSVDLASRRPLLARGRGAVRGLLEELAPDVLLANADEARALVGKDSQKLLALAPLVVIKEGAAGCRVLWLAAGSGAVLQLVVATSRLETADTTGAGDAFDAGFLHSLIEQAASAGRDRTAEIGPASDRTHALRRAQVLRRAAVVGHRSAAGWLRRPRPALEL